MLTFQSKNADRLSTEVNVLILYQKIFVLQKSENVCMCVSTGQKEKTEQTNK
jgi:hypothetical protein